MKKYIVLFLALSIAVAVSFSNFGGSDGAAEEEGVDAVYTSVAQTMTAMPTPTLQPTATIPPPTPTLFSLPTATLVTQSGSRGQGSQGNQGQGQSANTYVSPSFTSSESLCNNAVYVSDVTVPDGTVFSPGEAFEKTWMIYNAGTCTWDIGYSLSFLSGEIMDGVAVPLSGVVAPNEQVAVTVQMTAPLTTGSYTGYWQMADLNGITFGNAIFAQITVSGDLPTATSEVTATATVESTAVPTLEPTESAEAADSTETETTSETE